MIFTSAGKIDRPASFCADFAADLQLTYVDFVSASFTGTVGVASLFANLLIAGLIISKSTRRKACDNLVLLKTIAEILTDVNLTVNSILVVGFRVVSPWSSCLFSTFPFVFSSFFTALMVLLFAYNRYIAVMKEEITYETKFAPKILKKYLAAVVTLSLTLCAPLILICLCYNHVATRLYLPFFVLLRAFLVSLCWASLIVVYRGIALKLTLPLLAPLRNLRILHTSFQGPPVIRAIKFHPTKNPQADSVHEQTTDDSTDDYGDVSQKISIQNSQHVPSNISTIPVLPVDEFPDYKPPSQTSDLCYPFYHEPLHQLTPNTTSDLRGQRGAALVKSAVVEVHAASLRPDLNENAEIISDDDGIACVAHKSRTCRAFSDISAGPIAGLAEATCKPNSARASLPINMSALRVSTTDNRYSTSKWSNQLTSHEQAAGFSGEPETEDLKLGEENENSQDEYVLQAEMDDGGIPCDEGNSSDSEKKRVKLMRRKEKRQNEKHKITFSFFVLSFMFLLAVSPQILIVDFFPVFAPGFLSNLCLLRVESVSQFALILSHLLSPLLYVFCDDYLLLRVRPVWVGIFR